MANDAGLTQLHPGIFSTINSDQTTYETSNGVVTLFAADIFEKGPDNKIDFVSTKEEFIFKYGQPNYSKYGQQAYNIIKWLEAGGQAYIQRVLPDDATFAHSVVNVQTKVRKSEKVVDIQGKKVKLDDVHIRPTTTLIKKNNLNLEMLIKELNKDRQSEFTVDGYSNNFVLLTIPHGRGESYNNLGFRISPNTSFEGSQTSVVYNFEILRFESEQVATLVEGPFYVTFDPDSLSDTEDSMFIEDVINRQSKYLKVYVNLKAFTEVAKTINPNVKPTRVDILTGGAKDESGNTSYNPLTGRAEDIHINLHRYNSAGRAVTFNGRPVLNVPDSRDPVQSALVSLDNGLRESNYVLSSNKLQYMKGFFPKLRSQGFVEFTNNLDAMLKVGTNTEDITGTLKDLITNTFDEATEASLFKKYKTAYEAYKAQGNEHNLNNVISYINSLSEIVRTQYLDITTKIAACYSLTEHNSPNTNALVKYLSDVKLLMNKLNEKDLINIFVTKHKSVIFDIDADIASYEKGTSTSIASEGVSLVLNSVETEIKYIAESLLPVAYNHNVPTEVANKFSDTEEDSIVKKYNSAVGLLADIQRGIVPDTAANRTTIFKACKEICSALIDIINKVTIESNTRNIEEVINICKETILTDAKAFVSAVKAMIDINGSYTAEDVLDTARTNIETEINIVNQDGSKFFNTSLINFDATVKLLLGSDGSFTYNSLTDNRTRSEAVRRQLIKAYNGTLNPDVLNKDLYQFNVVLDARYHNDVKKAIVELARSMRQDFLFFANDAGPEYTVTPQDTLEWRQNQFNVNSEFVVIHGQDLTYYDEYTGKDIRFTPTYVLASKLPRQAVQYGLHYPIAGIRRGLIDGFKNISWAPNEAYREKLYKAKVNYIQRDSKTTRFNSNLTSINTVGAMSYINNMFTLLDIKRGCEELLVNYQFEFNDDETIVSLQSELNNYVAKYISNRSCESVAVEVYRSEYDKSQRIIRVKVSIKFNGVIERIVLNLNAKK